MDLTNLTEIVKLLGLVVGVIAAAVALFKESGGRRPHALEERHRRIKTFFEEGGVDRHPLLVETGFAAAVGHSKLNVLEIRFMLRQRKPLRFLQAYVASRDYVTLSEDGTRLLLTGLQRFALVRRLQVITGFTLYGVMGLAGVGLLLYVMPGQLMRTEWAPAASTLLAGLIGIGAAIVCLFWSAHCHWAEQLVEKQAPPDGRYPLDSNRHSPLT